MSAQAKIATVTLNPAIDQTVFIPNFQAGKVNRVSRAQADAGGKGVNVASILADFGCDVSVTGFLGANNPQLFERLFADKQIEDRFVRIAGETRIGIKIINEVTQETTDINFPGQTPTAENIRVLFQTIQLLAEDCRWFVLAGSIPAGVDPNIYADLIDAIAQKGRKVALDTSGEGLRRAISRKPSLMKPNIHELEELTGQPLTSQAEVLQAAQRLLDGGIECVIISMGADGAMFTTAQERILATPPNVPVLSTVGAGDAMISGMVAGRIRQLPLAECARLATAFSLCAISRVEAGLPDMATLNKFQEQVVMTTL